MDAAEDNHKKWENDEVAVSVFYTAAGVATNIAILSKFTGKMMLLDVGDGTLRDLLSVGNLDFVNEIDLIAITHGHFDHVGGLHSLLGFLRMMGRKDELNVLVPRKCSEALGIMKGFRQYYHETMPFELLYQELREGAEFDTDFFKVLTFGVEHFGLENSTIQDILMPALAFRVKVGQSVIAYTGDTRMCQGAEDAVRDADFALIEATRKKIPKSKLRVHLSENEAKQLGKLAKEYMLVHKIPAVGKWSASE